MSVNPSYSQDDVINFLKEALAHGWPSNLVPANNEHLPGFNETHYKRNSWSYTDLWGGAVTDIGYQAIFYEESAVWGTVYRGGILPDLVDTDPSPKAIFSFLAAALKARNPKDTFPLRGPARIRSYDRKMEYRFKILGNFSSFTAVEDILFLGVRKYQRIFLGGYFGDDAVYGPANPLFDSVFNM